MKRTTAEAADPTLKSVPVNGSSVHGCKMGCTSTCLAPGHSACRLSATRRPKRKWKPEIERDRSMRAYEQNPRALRDQLGIFGGERA